MNCGGYGRQMDVPEGFVTPNAKDYRYQGAFHINLLFGWGGVSSLIAAL